MTNFENLRKQAKQLQRWHRDSYHPVAARIRAGLPAFHRATDAEILAADFPLARAQELVAREQGFPNWQALRSGWSDMPTQSSSTDNTSRLLAAFPQILTVDFAVSRAFYVERLGFDIVYEYGHPPFYALVERGGARLNLRFVHRDLIDRSLAATEKVLAANVPVIGAKALFLEFRDRSVPIVQPLTTQPWGARDFVISDPDDNRLCFAESTVDGVDS
ncbi:MAG: VOC family protein [Gordonia polyisoprenivorans]|nr:VOC family protein [Gordonia polyisoprenivorans]